MTTHSYQTAVPALDRQAARTAIITVSEQFNALFRDTDNVDRPAAGTEWTVGQTAAHVAVALTAFSAAINAEPQALTPGQYLDADFPTRLAAANAATIDLTHHTDAGHLAESVHSATQRFLSITANAEPHRECATPWYGPGRTRTVDCLTALALGELTVHGLDIATGMGQRWPISVAQANLIVGTVCPEMSPLVVRPDAARRAPITFEIRLRGGGPRYATTVSDGAAEVRAAGGPVDCVISADPVAYLLVVYGRMSVRRALLRGKIVATGRRPWLALGFKNLFFNP